MTRLTIVLRGVLRSHRLDVVAGVAEDAIAAARSVARHSAASARATSDSGVSPSAAAATPPLTVIVNRLATCSRSRSANMHAPARSVCGMTMTNSSPPYRATRSVSRTHSSNRRGKLLQHAIAVQVPFPIVDLLEVVDVEHQPARIREW